MPRQQNRSFLEELLGLIPGIQQPQPLDATSEMIPGGPFANTPELVNPPGEQGDGWLNTILKFALPVLAGGAVGFLSQEKGPGKKEAPYGGTMGGRNLLGQNIAAGLAGWAKGEQARQEKAMAQAKLTQENEDKAWDRLVDTKEYLRKIWDTKTRMDTQREIAGLRAQPKELSDIDMKIKEAQLANLKALFAYRLAAAENMGNKDAEKFYSDAIRIVSKNPGVSAPVAKTLLSELHEAFAEASDPLDPNPAKFSLMRDKINNAKDSIKVDIVEAWDEIRGKSRKVSLSEEFGKLLSLYSAMNFLLKKYDLGAEPMDLESEIADQDVDYTGQSFGLGGNIDDINTGQQYTVNSPPDETTLSPQQKFLKAYVAGDTREMARIARAQGWDKKYIDALVESYDEEF